MWQYNYTDELYHAGTKGMKWGVRKYRNEDGTLTDAGKVRYNSRAERRAARKMAKATRRIERNLTAAGELQGNAEYERLRGREESRESYENASKYEKEAKQYEREGRLGKAKLARDKAESYKAEGDSIMGKYEAKAQAMVETAEFFNNRASKISTKKNVDIGKQRTNEILKTAKRNAIIERDLADTGVTLDDEDDD